MHRKMIAVGILCALTGAAAVMGQAAPAEPAPGAPLMQRGQVLGLDAVKKRMGATDEEWKVILPLLRKVMSARRIAELGLNGDGGAAAVTGGRFNGFGRNSFNGPGGPPGTRPFPRPAPNSQTPATRNAPADQAGPPRPRGGGRPFRPPGMGGGNTPLGLALTDLQTALTDPNADPDTLKEKVAAVRTARARAQSDLATAQNELLELLTENEIAVLASENLVD